jgi:hypothetical protein
LAYWEQTATTNTLFVDTLSSASVVSLPNPNNLIPQAIAFNSTGAQLVIAAEDANSNGELLTQTVTGGAAPNLIATQSVLLGTYGVYWTNSSGRVVGGSMGLSSVSRRRPYEPVNLQLVGP